MSGRAVSHAAAIFALALSAYPAVATAQGTAPPQEHSSHEPGEPAPRPAAQSPATGLPPITDADRKAAFPELDNRHMVHDAGVFTYVLFDRLEWQTGSGGTTFNWDTKGWIGGDVNRFWFRTEGEGDTEALGDAEGHALYGRAISRWWDVVVGVRQDARPGPARTWAAVGIQGLAPYWFEVEATAYLGESGRTHLRLESEYELLLTNRLVLQPLLEADIYGKSDPERGLGAGLSSIEAGLRLRFEVRREFAPYVGVSWSRKFFGTADRARAAGEETGAARLALGARVWF